MQLFVIIITVKLMNGPIVVAHLIHCILLHSDEHTEYLAQT